MDFVKEVSALSTVNAWRDLAPSAHFPQGNECPSGLRAMISVGSFPTQRLHSLPRAKE